MIRPGEVGASGSGATAAPGRSPGQLRPVSSPARPAEAKQTASVTLFRGQLSSGVIDVDAPGLSLGGKKRSLPHMRNEAVLHSPHILSVAGKIPCENPLLVQETPKQDRKEWDQECD